MSFRIIREGEKWMGTLIKQDRPQDDNCRRCVMGTWGSLNHSVHCMFVSFHHKIRSNHFLSLGKELFHYVHYLCSQWPRTVPGTPWLWDNCSYPRPQEYERHRSSLKSSLCTLGSKADFPTAHPVSGVTGVNNLTVGEHFSAELTSFWR